MRATGVEGHVLERLQQVGDHVGHLDQLERLAQLVAEKGSPVADITYLGVTFGVQAKKEGVRDLRQSGLIKVKKGLTSLEEVEAVTNE